MIGIYAIENNVNHMFYVGQSKNIQKRMKEHGYNKGSRLLALAMQEYGKENFSYHVLEECTVDKLDALEMHYIKKLNCMYPNGYNITSGGTNHGAYGSFNGHTCLTESDVYAIREDYKNHVNVNDAYAKFSDRMTINGFKSIWNGYSWKRVHMDVYTKENRKWHRLNYDHVTNHPRTVCDEDVEKIRDIKNEGKLGKKEAKDMFPYMNINTFNDIWYYHTFKHIKSSKPVNNPGKMRRKPIDQRGTKNPTSIFTTDDVTNIRSRKKMGETAYGVYKEYRNVCSMQAFYNLWNGRTYQTV